MRVPIAERLTPWVHARRLPPQSTTRISAIGSSAERAGSSGLSHSDVPGSGSATGIVLDVGWTLVLALLCRWCHHGTMKRMNLRDVPEEVYDALVAAAEDSRQSLSSFVVDRLVEVARSVRVAEYVSTYPTPSGTGVTADDAVAAVREVREAS